MKKVEMLAAGQDWLKENPEEKVCHVTSDGNIFRHKNLGDANTHAKREKLTLIEVTFEREVEDDSQKDLVGNDNPLADLTSNPETSNFETPNPEAPNPEGELNTEKTTEEKEADLLFEAGIQTLKDAKVNHMKIKAIKTQDQLDLALEALKSKVEEAKTTETEEPKKD